MPPLRRSLFSINIRSSRNAFEWGAAGKPVTKEGAARPRAAPHFSPVCPARWVSLSFSLLAVSPVPSRARHLRLSGTPSGGRMTHPAPIRPAELLIQPLPAGRIHLHFSEIDVTPVLLVYYLFVFRRKNRAGSTPVAHLNEKGRSCTALTEPGGMEDQLCWR